MTTPEAEFGESLRRALAAVDHVDPSQDALDRIKRRTRTRTPRQELGAALAVLTPWPVFRVLAYRTLAVDLLRGWRARVQEMATATAQRFVAVADDLTRRGFERCLAPMARRVAPYAGRCVEFADLVTGRGVGYAQRGFKKAAAALGRWFAPASRSWRRLGLPHPAPRHADQDDSPGRNGWVRPAVTAGSVAFVATLALTVPSVRQAIAQISSTVMPTSSNSGGTNASTLMGGARHGPGSGPQPGGQPGGSTGSHHGKTRPSGHGVQPLHCPTPTYAPGTWPTATPCATSTPSVTSSPTSPPTPSVSPSVTPSPTVSPTPTPSPPVSPSASASAEPPIQSSVAP
jgi:hypothetical protein